MYKEYWKETFGRDVVENESGFASYKITGDYCYIVDIYVKPEYRKMNIASKLADKICVIAKERKCKHVIGTVNLQSSDPTRSMAVLIGYGMKIHTQDTNTTVLIKDI